MHFLVLSLSNPVPANNGVKMRTWAIMQALAAEGHKLSLLAFREAGEASTPDRALLDVCTHVELIAREHRSLSLSRNYLSRLQHLISPTPFGVLASASRAMRSRIAELAGKLEIDAILCEQADPLINLPSSIPLPLIVDNHNVEHRILERYAAIERNPAKRLYAWMESRKIRAWERRACQRAATN